MPNPSNSGREILQARKQEVVRQQIWTSAIDLFHATGFDEVTVEQISLHAGVSRRTFFRYFSSKEDVLASAVRNYAEALIARITSDTSAHSGVEVVKQSIVHVLQPFLATSEKVMCISRRSVSVRSAYLHQGPLVQTGLAAAFALRAGHPESPTLEDRVLANLTMLGTNLCVEMWVEHPERPLAEIVDEVFAAFASVTAAR